MIYTGNVLKEIKKIDDESVDCIITSPPYYALRDYGAKGQIGLEKTPEAFVQVMVDVFRECRRVLKKDGTLWLNLGDTYANKSAPGGSSPMKRDRRKLAKLPKVGVPAGYKAKDLLGIPWRVAFALQADGWYLRQDIIWAKPNPMPESVSDRCTKAHEYVFLMSKSPVYYYDQDAIRTPLQETSLLRFSQGNIENQLGSDRVPGKKGRMKPVRKDLPGSGKKLGAFRDEQRTNGKDIHPAGANKKSVWSIPTMPFAEAHFATFPEKLIEPMVLAGSRRGGVVFDPFLGSGTTAIVASRLGRQYVGIELNPEYAEMARKRISAVTPPLL